MLTRFERAYRRLYNGEITLEQFPEACGLSDDEAHEQLARYRREVVEGQRIDPRDKFPSRWTRYRGLIHSIFRG